VINVEGKIECAEVLALRHPDVEQYALDALKKWTFKPVEVDGKPIAALGIAAVDVSWDSSPEQCRSRGEPKFLWNGGEGKPSAKCATSRGQ
jgi:hypothetical protein